MSRRKELKREGTFRKRNQKVRREDILSREDRKEIETTLAEFFAFDAAARGGPSWRAYVSEVTE